MVLPRLLMDRAREEHGDEKVGECGTGEGHEEGEWRHDEERDQGM